MIEIINAQNRKHYEHLLLDMFALRYKVIVGEWHWDLPDARDNIDIDQFDKEDTVYVVRLNESRDRVLGCCRLNIADGNEMMTVLFSEACDLEPVPSCTKTLEASRFVIAPDIGHKVSYKVLWELCIGVNEYCVKTGIENLTWFANVGFYSALGRVFNIRPLGRPKHYPNDNDTYIPAAAEINSATALGLRQQLNNLEEQLTFMLTPLMTPELEWTQQIALKEVA